MATNKCTRKIAPLRDRFNIRVDRSGGPDACWPWTGSSTSKGYGKIGTSSVYAHRLAITFHTGKPIPPGMCVLHSCDNPPCCNHRHLRIGTQAENLRDMALRGRSNFGERSPRSKLTDVDIRTIRDTYAKGETSQRALASTFGVGHRTIIDVLHRVTWRHVD